MAVCALDVDVRTIYHAPKDFVRHRFVARADIYAPKCAPALEIAHICATKQRQANALIRTTNFELKRLKLVTQSLTN